MQNNKYRILQLNTEGKQRVEEEYALMILDIHTKLCEAEFVNHGRRDQIKNLSVRSNQSMDW